MATANGRAAAQFAYQRLLSHGVSPAYAAAAVGHLIEESGWFSPDVIAGNRRGDRGTAAYVAQWRGDRLANLQRFARSQNRPIDLATQIDFIVHEGDAGLDSGAQRWLAEARSGRGGLQDGVAAFAHFERPAGYNVRNPRQIATFGKRLEHANAVAGLVGGAAPGVGAEMPEYLRNVAGTPGSPQQAQPYQTPGGQQVPTTSRLSNVGFDTPNLSIDYGAYGIETPSLTNGGMSQSTAYNGMPYTRAFGNDPYLEGQI